MNVSDQIIQVLNYLATKFGIVIDWTSEDVVPYISTLCQKLITYEIWTSVAWIALMTALSIAAVIIAVRFRIFSSDFWCEHDFAAPFILPFFIAIWACTVFCIGTQVFDIIKCVTFPEMYAFEYIQNILNSTR
jgi:hypothetical protein